MGWWVAKDENLNRRERSSASTPWCGRPQVERPSTAEPPQKRRSPLVTGRWSHADVLGESQSGLGSCHPSERTYEGALPYSRFLWTVLAAPACAEGRPGTRI